jgi:large subunit ribosomal protein L16
MLMPRKTKHRKLFKGKIHGSATQGADIVFGQYGLQALAPDRITARQIESARRSITRHVKRMGQVWIRMFPDVPVTSKPAEVRMGSGKGSIDYWACRVKPGRILFEIGGVPMELAREAFRLASRKLQIETRFVQRSSRGL